MFSKRTYLYVTAATVVLVGLGWWASGRYQQREPIKVGVLHSLTGPIAISERAMVDAELLAIEEINASGGIHGRMIEPVIADGRSDWPTFAAEAEKLITEHGVVTVFGCWTSASRKTVRPIFEKHDHLLVYPMAYEGLEASPNIIYTGAAPNQQILPALKWGLDNFGSRIFLIGSDYVWPHSINAIMRDSMGMLGASLVGEEYVFFGSTDLAAVTEKIKLADPDFILSSVVGDSNAAFFAALREVGIRPENTPVISFSVSESELERMNPADLAGHYAAWNYFQALPGEINERFVNTFRARYGADRAVSDVVEISYFSVLLWAQAARESNELNPRALRRAMLNQSIEAAEGIVSIDPDTGHAWRPVYLGQFTGAGTIDVVWSAVRPMRPVPYPDSRTPREWEDFLARLYQGWGGNWANTTAP
jgi:urea transport system substrate-binding protein